MNFQNASTVCALLAGMIFPTAAYAQATAASPTARQTVTEEGFTIQFPTTFSKPARQVQTIKSESGPIKQVTFVSKSPEGVACVMAYSELTGDILDPKKMMESGRDSLLKSLNAQIESEKDDDIDGHPGMSFLYSASAPKAIAARTDLLVAGPRMYQLIYITPSVEARQQPSAQECFSGFKVTSVTTAAPTPEPAAMPGRAASTASPAPAASPMSMATPAPSSTPHR
ncbi:MAG: hypothetical protein ABI718_14340 [Acidobacteriota bacterium]